MVLAVPEGFPAHFPPCWVAFAGLCCPLMLVLLFEAQSFGFGISMEFFLPKE